MRCDGLSLLCLHTCLLLCSYAVICLNKSLSAPLWEKETKRNRHELTWYTHRRLNAWDGHNLCVCVRVWLFAEALIMCMFGLCCIQWKCVHVFQCVWCVLSFFVVLVDRILPLLSSWLNMICDNMASLRRNVWRESHSGCYRENRGRKREKSTLLLLIILLTTTVGPITPIEGEVVSRWRNIPTT